jgi:hypothetical protein
MHCFMQRGEASEPAVTDCNLTVPIATLGANRDSQELLLHPDFPGPLGRCTPPWSCS